MNLYDTINIIYANAKLPGIDISGVELEVTRGTKFHLLRQCEEQGLNVEAWVGPGVIKVTPGGSMTLATKCGAVVPLDFFRGTVVQEDETGDDYYCIVACVNQDGKIEIPQKIGMDPDTTMMENFDSLTCYKVCAHYRRINK